MTKGNSSYVRTAKRDNPFVQVDKFFINDDRLSWKAKGLMVYFLSKPDTWSILVADLVNRSTDGEKAVYSGLNELQANGYLTIERDRGEQGRFSGTVYTVYERPIEVVPEEEEEGEESTVPTKQGCGENPVVPTDASTSPKGGYGESTTPPLSASRLSASRKGGTINNDLSNSDNNNNDNGRMGEVFNPADDIKEKYLLFKGFCENRDINKQNMLDMWKIYIYHYDQAPVSVVISTLSELLNDKYQFKGGGVFTEQEYKNICGLFHYRMKQWKKLQVAIEDIDG